MYSAEISLDKLVAEGRWNVEFFAGEAKTQIASPYECVRLADVTTERRDFIDPQAEPSREFNYLGLENIAPHTGDLVSFRPRMGIEIRSRSKAFSPGDILYGRLRPYLNKVYLCEGPVAAGICSGEFIVLAPTASKVLPRVLRALLASPYVLDHVARFQSGAALPRIPARDLCRIEIPLPPLEEQRRIDALLEAQDSRRRQLSKILEEMPGKTVKCLLDTMRTGDIRRFAQIADEIKLEGPQ